ncbi:MAG: hypothetical protein AABZ14_00395 [Candidatus Margulisiibacteriota bacterium]
MPTMDVTGVATGRHFQQVRENHTTLLQLLIEIVTDLTHISHTRTKKLNISQDA